MEEQTHIFAEAKKKSKHKHQHKLSVKRRDNRSALFIPAGLFIGMGIGYLQNNFLAWLFIGMGVGFVIFAILKLTENMK